MFVSPRFIVRLLLKNEYSGTVIISQLLLIKININAKKMGVTTSQQDPQQFFLNRRKFLWTNVLKCALLTIF
jgi:hypothetical protein